MQRITFNSQLSYSVLHITNRFSFCFNSRRYCSVQSYSNEELYNYVYKLSNENNDANSQLLLGVLLCEKASNILNEERKQYSKDNFNMKENGIVHQINNTNDDINQLTSKPKFLKWVRNEKKRLLSRKGDKLQSPLLKEVNLCIIEAFYWFLQSANQNNGLSMYMVGSLIYDEILSIRVYNELEKENVKESFNTIENIYINQLSSEEKINCNIEGYKWLWKAALGDISYNINPPSTPLKDSWNLQKKENQCGLAWFDLGVIHYNGQESIDIKKSKEYATELYKIAADNHNIADAYFWLGYDLWEDNWDNIPKEERINHMAIKRMFEAAKYGNSEAMYFIAVSYFNGVLDDNKEFQNSIGWMKKSAESGNKKALHILGNWYAQGLNQAPHIDVDYTKAKSYFLQSIQIENLNNEQSLEDSMSYCSLGVLYLHGYGTQKDEMKAFECYQKAAMMGNPHACLNVADMLSKGIGVGKNLKSAKRYEELARTIFKNQDE